MATKEATIFIVDVGKTMGEKRNGRDESNLDFGMRYVWDKIAEIMITGRVTLNVGVIGLRTDGTDNALGDEEAYKHISILQPLGPMKMPQLKKLQDAIKVSNTVVGDPISAIIIAIELIEQFTKKLKYLRKIILVTDARSNIDGDDVEEIANKLKREGIQLIVVGLDFDDAEFGFKEEDKDALKASNEALLKSLVENSESGIIGTAEEAVHDLSIPRVKETRPYASFKGQLTLGDPEKYDTAMCIDVERYFRTKIARAPTASSFVNKEGPGGAGEASTQSSHTVRGENDVEANGAADTEGLAAVKTARAYKVVDETAPGGKRDVDREDLAKGYEYGRTAVAISESDENVTKLETQQSFSIVGFIPSEKYERFFNMGESNVTLAQRANDKARMALSSLIHALHELDSYAIARIVLKDGKDPLLVVMAPSIEPDLECLVDVPLPFAEDVRLYRFPPLDRVITVSGSVLTKHRNLPEEDLTKAMDAYVDKMDLSTFDKDDEGQPTEYMTIEDTYAPVLHRINQAIRRRAVRPDEPVQPPADILVKYSHPPPELVEASQKELERLVDAADLKKVPPKVKGKRTRETQAPLSGLDVEALLGREKRVKVTNENSIPEFKQMLETAEDVETIRTATKQMSDVIRSLISHSLGNSGYGRAIENLRVMREELINMEEPGLYNDFVTDLKKQLLDGDLGGDRRDMMWEIRKVKLGLVDKTKSEVSEVTEVEATEFYSMKKES